jgi:hypothetical protein
MPPASSTMPRPTSHGGGSSSISASGSHFSTASYQQNPSFPVPYEVLHPSLQRNAHSLVVDHATSAALAAAAASVSGGSKVGSSASTVQLHVPDGRPGVDVTKLFFVFATNKLAKKSYSFCPWQTFQAQHNICG